MFNHEPPEKQKKKLENQMKFALLDCKPYWWQAITLTITATTAGAPSYHFLSPEGFDETIRPRTKIKKTTQRLIQFQIDSGSKISSIRISMHRQHPKSPWESIFTYTPHTSTTTELTTREDHPQPKREARETGAFSWENNYLQILQQRNLLTLSPTALADLAIPTSSKLFLRHLGLPEEGMWNLNFDFSPDSLQTIEEYSTHVSTSLPGVRHFRYLGNCESSLICVDERRGGCLLMINPLEKSPESFINSSIELFAECFVCYWDTIPDDDDEKIGSDKVWIQELTDRLKALDQRALEHPDTDFWQTMIEDLYI